MIVRNEERFLERCLNHVKPFVDEIIIVDTGSTDNTKSIAKKYTSHVYDFEWNHDFSDARNEALRHATGDWILVLDADEMILTFPENFKKSLLTPFLGTIEIVSPYISKETQQISKSHIPRLFPNGFFFTGSIHEQVECNLDIKPSGIIVQHDGYVQSKASRNIPLLRFALNKDPRSTYLHYQIGREYYGDGSLQSALEHFETCYSLMSGRERFYPAATVSYLYALLDAQNLENAYEIIHANMLTLHDFTDFHFFCGLFYTDYLLNHIDTHANQLFLIENSYLKCLSLGENKKYNGILGTGSFLAAHNLAIFYELLGERSKAEEYYDLERKLKKENI